MVQTNTWDVQIAGSGTDCTNPTGGEGDEACINGFIHTCTSQVWVKNDPEEPCGITDCDQYTSQGQTACETAGCYWYAYPNPFGEPQCWGTPIFVKYLPYIAVGVGALVVLAALLKRKKTVPYYPYYPPPGGR